MKNEPRLKLFMPKTGLQFINLHEKTERSIFFDSRVKHSEHGVRSAAWLLNKFYSRRKATQFSTFFCQYSNLSTSDNAWCLTFRPAWLFIGSEASDVVAWTSLMLHHWDVREGPVAQLIFNKTVYLPVSRPSSKCEIHNGQVCVKQSKVREWRRFRALSLAAERRAGANTSDLVCKQRESVALPFRDLLCDRVCVVLIFCVPLQRPPHSLTLRRQNWSGK